MPGDFVYVRQPGTQQLGAGNLQAVARDVILRVRQVRETGVLVLEGRDGRTMDAHVSECAPCHLPNIDMSQDLSLLVPAKDKPCVVCMSPLNEETMLLCDGCNDGVHLSCLVPPLQEIPVGNWLCPGCDEHSPHRFGFNAQGSLNLFEGQEYRVKRAGQWVKATVQLVWPRSQRPFQLTFPDGKKTRVSRQHVETNLYPVCSASPVGALGIVRFTTAEECRGALTQVMPGFHPPTHFPAIQALIQLSDANPPLKCEGLSADMCLVLSSVLDTSRILTVVDPWGQQTAWYRVWRTQAPHVTITHPGECTSHSLQPTTYLPGQPVWIAQPHPDLLDLYLGLGSSLGVECVCLAAPITYFSSAGSGRRTWLNLMKTGGRLGVVLGPEVEAGRVQLIWILVFRDLASRGLLTNGMAERWARGYSELGT